MNLANIVDYVQLPGIGTYNYTLGGVNTGITSPITSTNTNPLISTTAPTTTSNKGNVVTTLITTVGGVISSIFGKPNTQVVYTPSGTTTSPSGTGVVIGADGASITNNVTGLTQKKWFWPVVIILLLLLIFIKPLKRMIR